MQEGEMSKASFDLLLGKEPPLVQENYHKLLMDERLEGGRRGPVEVSIDRRISLLDMARAMSSTTAPQGVDLRHAEKAAEKAGKVYPDPAD